jgi:hypothetical protein
LLTSLSGYHAAAATGLVFYLCQVRDEVIWNAWERLMAEPWDGGFGVNPRNADTPRCLMISWKFP